MDGFPGAFTVGVGVTFLVTSGAFVGDGLFVTVGVMVVTGAFVTVGVTLKPFSSFSYKNTPRSLLLIVFL